MSSSYPLTRSKMPRPEAIIFDLDGTLINTGHMLEQAFIAAFADHAIELEPSRFQNWISQDKQLFNDLSPQGNFPTGLPEAIDTHYLEIISKHGVQWLDGVSEEIEKLQEQLPLAIFTNAPRSYVHAASQYLPLTSLFACIVSLDDVAPKGKPYPDGILLCCRTLGINPKQCIYIGDHVMDMMTARAAGSTAVLIPSEVTNSLAYEKADIVLNHIHDIHNRLI